MRIKDLKVEMGWNGARIIIHTDDKQAAASVYENAGRIIPDAEYDVTVKKRRKRRSLDANAYMWQLLHKLGEKVQNSPEELYKTFVRNYGKYYVVPIREDAISDFTAMWSAHGLGWFVDDIGACRKTAGYRNLRLFYGSSQYDTKTMSRLIEEVVEECKAQGIETMTPDELKELMRGERINE